jgi:hypothetical protein
LDSSFVLPLGLLLFHHGKKIVALKTLESWMRGNVVANSINTIQVVSVIDKTSKCLKNDKNICH